MAKSREYIEKGEFSCTFDALVTSAITKWHVPGLSISVLESDGTIISKGYGHARFSPNEAVKPSTLFHCASMTKAFTAAAVSLLVDDNEKYPSIQWTTPVSEILPEDFVLIDAYATQNVTVEDILSHRTSFPDHDLATYGIYAKQPDTPKSVVRNLRNLPLNGRLREKYQYSNIMYVAASHLIETVTGQSLCEFLHERFFKPLGMRDTYFGMDDLEQSRGTDQLAQGFKYLQETQEFKQVPWLKQPEGSGAGELISTSPDYLKFVQMLLKREKPLSEKGHEELIKPRIWNGQKRKAWMSHQLYALGVEVDTYHGEQVIGHEGCIHGYYSKNLWVPRLGWGVVVHVNCGDAEEVLNKICWTLIDDLLGVAEEQRYDWDDILQKESEKPECESIEELFPDTPSPPLPHALEIEEYVGAYEHAGYGVLELELDGEGKGLVCDITDRTLRIMMPFVHVSGEKFCAEMVGIETTELERARAEFRIVDGKVTELGVAMSLDMDELIWFKRSGDGREQ